MSYDERFIRISTAENQSGLGNLWLTETLLFKRALRVHDLSVFVRKTILKSRLS